MGAVEEAVDNAAGFIGPYIGKDKGQQHGQPVREHEAIQLVEGALFHLQAINAAEQAADPNAPYDASLVGIVYGLLDLTTSVGLLPHISQGVAFSQRPRSVLATTISVPRVHNDTILSHIMDALLPILEQNGTGIQPLLTQRALPDIISALAELSFSPRASDGTRTTYEPLYGKTMTSVPTSRLLPVLTTLLQQDVPSWWKPRLSRELAMVPLRHHGVRHTIEFLSLSYLSKNSQVPQDAEGSHSQLPLPLEAITQASRLLTSVPSGLTQDEWFTKLAPELLELLDGSAGKELSRAAGQVIASGILNKKSTGAPGTVGWELFGKPLQNAIYPHMAGVEGLPRAGAEGVLVSEQDLRLSLRRLATIASSYSYAGLMKRLIGPIFLPLWGLLNHASSRPSLDKEWTELPRAILLRHLTIACEPNRIDLISNNLFWDGTTMWTFAPGSHGGIEVRQRMNDAGEVASMEGILSRIGSLDERIHRLVSLLSDAKVEDQIVGAIFLQTTRKWLSPTRAIKPTLTDEPDADPLSALVNAKFAEALATMFKDKFVRSPNHIVELMGQLLQNFVDEHQARSNSIANAHKPNRANLGRLTQAQGTPYPPESESESDDLASFALSILNTIIASPDFRRTTDIDTLLNTMLPSLQYISQNHRTLPIPTPLVNIALNILRTLQPSAGPASAADPLDQYRMSVKAALTELTSPEPPERTWALSSLRKLVQDPASLPVIDAPSLTQSLLIASVADPDSYVHTAAIPLLVNLAARVPNPTIRILVDAFLDVDERSLRLKKEKEIEQALDFRLRIGEILNSLVLEETLWASSAAPSTKYGALRTIIEAALSLASRRGQRKQTLAKRQALAEDERRQQEEGEAAWDGPIPNLLDPDAENPTEQAERDALFRIVQGWEDTGLEEDVRIRASALSILSSIMEQRLELLNQSTVDAGLQMVLLILTMETSGAKGILRRAAVLVAMGLLKGMDALLEAGKESIAGMGMKQMEEVERVMSWVRDEDADGLVKDHAQSVLEGLETWRMKKLYRIRDDGLTLTPNLGLEGNLRGLSVQPLQDNDAKGARKLVVEEVE